MALNDMFDGPVTSDGESSPEAVVNGTYMLVVQGEADGAKVNVLANVFGSEYDHLDGGLVMKGSGFRVFRICDCSLKVVVSDAGPATSLNVGILPS